MARPEQPHLCIEVPPAESAGKRPRELLSVSVCRLKLGSLAEGMSDSTVGNLRDQLYALAGACRTLQASTARDFRAAINSLDPATRDELEERAAILEFDGKLCRPAAEASALSCIPREQTCAQSSTAESRRKSRRRI
jgi:hypothetical protein